jgi:eukaryotic-like serine/threonine-protein kinase
LGPYRIEALLGSGGMGSVYCAVDTRLERRVAVKIPSEPFSDRFKREARAIAALNHPNICTLHDVGPNYLVMELIEGPTLAERIRKGPLPVEEALAIARQIAEALEAAHEKGIVHRDLKPANIKVKPDGAVKVLDFGLARVMRAPGPPGADDPTHSLTVTEAGMIVGTPAYMAPEQALGKTVDKRADIWAFGVILYEMVTGSRLFAGATTAETLHAVLTQEPDWDRVPAGVRPVLRRCLEKDPKRRLRDIGDAQFTIEEIPAVDSPPPAKLRRWWIACAAAVALAAAGVWVTTQLRQTAADPPVLRLEITPPDGSQFASATNSTGISLSPDGRYAAYVVAAKGDTALWLRPLDGSAARMLEGTEGAALPFWSPDGKSVAFFANDKLKRVELAGGGPQTIAEVGLAIGGAWSPSGQILYGGWSSGLFQVAASGGKPVPLTTPDAARGEAFHYWPQMLPGGGFLYFVRSSKPEYTGVYAASLAAPHKAVQLLNTAGNALYAPLNAALYEHRNPNDQKGHLLWLRGATLLAQEFDAASLKLSGEPHPIADPVASLGVHGQIRAAVSATGVLLFSASNPLGQFVWYDRAGKPQGMLGEPAAIGQFRLSPDGRRIAMSAASPGGADLWMLDVDRGVTTRFTSRPGISNAPVWSRDGRTILFASGSPFNLFRKDANGTAAEQRLTESPNLQFPVDWSPDGRYILIYEFVGNQRSLQVLPASPAGGLARPYLRSSFNDGFGSISPDGHWVAFSSEESGRAEVYVDAFPEARGKVRISTGGGMFPQWADGGRELFYVAADSMLMSVMVKLGPGTVEPSAARAFFPVTQMDGGISPYLSTPDGKRILVLEPEKAVRPLKVIVNWPALLK